jgi:glycine hydroxymethyltransferase
METIVGLIDEVISNHDNEAVLEHVAEQVNTMMKDLLLFA